MSDAGTTFEFLAAQMINAETQWSLGTFGGIAEFMRDPNEPVTITRNGKSFSAVTVRGGVRIRIKAPKVPIKIGAGIKYGSVDSTP